MAIFSICKQINDPRIDRKRVHSADAIVLYRHGCCHMWRGVLVVR